ncbi:hypothetical protein O6H91_11G005800 [Diphasiastrum complanatum]|uniref:Uncharacterized protein n=1 Tax=Diphasiastrum complanatum TaxID=34168 RepID=A0ACC2C5X0_DIPCM|nr:hypothetical protein O6H91_Y435500 [Diphasiastrum complanatum]KAJ7537433.1 hypothetical protein O6H91_11G005800 [Diphasiastrum complanatum]
MAAASWGTMDPLATLSDDDQDSSDDEHEDSVSNSEQEDNDHHTPRNASQKEHATMKPTGGGISKKSKVDFEALSRHGYSGGPSILYVPAPRQQQIGNSDWSWSDGKQKQSDRNEGEESYEEREHTRTTVNAVAATAAAEAIFEYHHTKRQKDDAIAEQRALSFSKKEKRKRDLGQSSRGKNYVEEEKRLLRDQGVYSGFDT